MDKNLETSYLSFIESGDFKSAQKIIDDLSVKESYAKANIIGKALVGAIDFIQSSINYRSSRTSVMGEKH